MMLAPFVLISWLGCGATGADPVADAPAAEEAPTSIGPRPSSWVTPRADEARERLEGTEGGRLLLEAIDAHGGLTRWYASGVLRFDFDYQPLGDESKRRHTLNEVDVWSSRVRQTVRNVEEPVRFGWTGSDAWIEPREDAFRAARFWSLTPYYFVAIPFVLADPGTVHERVEPQPLDGVLHDVVKVTYDPATVAYPDDYYLVYLDPTSRRVAALRYVVTWPEFHPDGGRSPEKLMRWLELAQVDGLWLVDHAHTFAYDEATGAQGALTTELTVRGYERGLSVEPSFFDAPASSVPLP